MIRRLAPTRFLVNLLVVGCFSFLTAACTSSADGLSAQTCDWPVEPVLEPLQAPNVQSSPFPSDLFLVKANTATGYQVNVTSQGLLFQDLLNQQNGWAPHGAIRVGFSGGITLSSLPQTVTESTSPQSALQIVDLETGERVPFRVIKGADMATYYLLPFHPMKEERRHAVIVRDTTEPIVAECSRRNPRFSAIVNGNTPAGFTDEQAKNIRAVYAELKSRATELAIEPQTIALAVPYTTQSITRELIAKRALITAAPITTFTVKSFPALDTDGTLHPDLEARFPSLPSDLEFGVDAKLDNVSHIVIGYFKIDDYRNECDIAWGEYLWVNTVQCEETLEYLISFPKMSRIREPYLSKVKETGRFPVVVFGHGLTACKETMLAISNTFAEYGFAVAGIDVVEHGSRNFADPFDTCGETIAEGLRIMRGAKPTLFRDNARQTALDEMAFLQMLASEKGRDYLADTTNATGLLKVDAFGYIGQSLGGMIGTAFVAIDERITAAVLNVPGGGVADFVTAIDADIHDPADVEVLPNPYYWETLAAVQMILGPADPLYYAPYLNGATSAAFKNATRKHVLVQQGMEDEVMPLWLTENLARALGATQIEPAYHRVADLPLAEAGFSGAVNTVALTQFKMTPLTQAEKDAKKKDWNAHYMLSIANDMNTAFAIQEQAARFLWTGMMEGEAEVISGF